LIYIDCTGAGAWDRAAPPDIVIDFGKPEEAETLEEILLRLRGWLVTDIIVKFPSHTAWDKLAFVEEGEKLGFMGINCHFTPEFDFVTLEFDYDWYRLTKQAYEADTFWDDLREMLIAFKDKVEATSKFVVDVEEQENIQHAIDLALFKAEELMPCYHWKESDTAVMAIRIYW